MRVKSISSQGLALLWVLVLLCVVSSLSLMSLQSAWLQQKMLRQVIGKQLVFTSANNVISMFEQQNNTICDIPQQWTQDFLHQPLSWWQSLSSCSDKIQGFTYYYRREKIATFECSYIQKLSDTTKSNSVIFFRHTLLFKRNHSSRISILLQTTQAMPGPFSSHCKALAVFSGGRQSWRELHTKG